MLLSARFTAQRLASTGVRCLSAGEIPVNTVCRVVSMNVGDEATALKMDEIVNTYKTEVLSTVPGFTGLERKVCKSEWDYSTTMHFENIDSLARTRFTARTSSSTTCKGTERCNATAVIPASTAHLRFASAQKAGRLSFSHSLLSVVCVTLCLCHV